jgi:hypothetical protein
MLAAAKAGSAIIAPTGQIAVREEANSGGIMVSN